MTNKLKLKDIYLSATNGMKIKRIKERIKKEKETVKSNVSVKKTTLSEERLNEDFISDFLDKFFEKVKRHNADDIIKKARNHNDDLANALDTIQTTTDDVAKILHLDKEKHPDTDWPNVLDS
jgi:hypothetical protein